MKAARLFGLVVGWFVWAAAAAELGGANPDEMRGKAREAFARGDYEAMAKAYEPLADWSLGQCHDAIKAGRVSSMRFDECFDDCLGLGHAYQLAGNWAGAISAYRSATEVIKTALRAAPPDAGGRTSLGAQRANLERDYVRLLRLIGCIQRDALKDPQAAAATLARATDFCPLLRSSVAELTEHYLKRVLDFTAEKKIGRDFAFERATLYPRQALRELAITQQQLGQVNAAIETWSKVNLTRAYVRGAGVQAAELAPLHALVEKLPAGQAAPRVPGLLVLSPAAPALTLNMDDSQTLTHSCGWWGGGDSDYWQFALFPSRGQEFATLEFACDLEQLDPRYGGQFKCWAKTTGDEAGTVSIGSIGWLQKPPGRAIIKQEFPIPRGAGAAYTEVGIAPGKFKVHNLAVKATFRPWEELATRPEGVAPKADVWMQSECIPPDGTLTRNGEEIKPGTATSGMRAGRYVFTYKAATHPETYRCEADFAPGGRYGLFISLDSPFRWKLTNLRGFSMHPPSRASLVRLPDGRWLAAYGSGGSGILLSASADGEKWDKPWQLPHTSIGDSIEPTLHLSSKGTLWLAYFNNRLVWPSVSTGGYQLWLTSSRDGRDWSPPRPLLVTLPGIKTAFWREFGSLGGWPCGATQLVEGPEGRHWLFWRNYVARADAPESIRELRRIAFEGGANPDVRCAHAVADAAGRLHMVFVTWAQGISYCTSADGQQWSAPVPLDVVKPAGMLEEAQLILDGARAALLYGGMNGSWLCRGTLDPAPKFEPPVKITNHVIPLCGSRACLTPDGQVTILAGKSFAWLLSADRNTLSRPVHKF